MNDTPTYRYATSSGARLGPDGALVHYTQGEAWHAADPFVHANPTLFSSQPPRVRGVAQRPADDRVERATRRPGERRS